MKETLFSIIHITFYIQEEKLLSEPWQYQQPFHKLVIGRFSFSLLAQHNLLEFQEAYPRQYFEKV